MEIHGKGSVLVMCTIVCMLFLIGADGELMMSMPNSTSMTPMTSNTENRLIDDLLSEYSRYIRPVYNESTVLYVYYHMRLSRILQIDERNQILVTAIWLEQSWIDEYLAWDPKDYDNITSVHIPTTMIWIPDTVLYNSADVDKELGNEIQLTNAVVYNNGTVFWQAPAIFKSSCKMYITYFPFDQHGCNLQFGPWIYKGNEVVMKKVADSGDFSNLSPNGQWQLLGMPVEEHLIKYSCCPQPFSDITFEILLRRKALYYVFNLLFPSVFMSLVSLLSFYLPPESGEKVGLNITMLLALIFFLLLGAQLLPPTSDSFSLLGQLFTTIIAIMSLETAISVIVLRLYHLRLTYPPPAWARWFFLDRTAKFLRLGSLYHEFVDDSASLKLVEYTKSQSSSSSSSGDPFEFDNRKASIDSRMISESLLQKLDLDIAGKFAEEPEKKEKHSSEDSDYGSEISDESIGSSVMRIGNYLRRLVGISRKNEATSAIQQQWIDLCFVVDRVLFIIIATCLILGCFIILVMMSTDKQ